MKIAIYTDTFLPQINGVVTMIVETAKEFVKQGHKVMVFTVDQGEKIEIPDVKINYSKSLTMPTYKEHRIAMPNPIKNLSAINEFNPDIIHIHTPFMVGWEGITAGKMLGIPVVGTHHTFLSEYLKYIKVDKDFMKKLAEKYIGVFYNRCNLVTSPSKALAKIMKEGGCKSELLIVPNALNLARFKPINTNKIKEKFNLCKKNVIFTGRIGYEKSIDVLIKAMEFVIKHDKEIKLVIIGDGPITEELQDLAEDLGVKDNVVFTGFLTDQELIDCISSGKIFVTASVTENQPMTILEAMACGLAIIGVNARGVPELINDGENGFLADPNDSKRIAHYINQLFNDEKLMQEMSVNSLKKIKSYSIDNIAKQLLDLYSELKK